MTVVPCEMIVKSRGEVFAKFLVERYSCLVAEIAEEGTHALMEEA